VTFQVVRTLAGFAIVLVTTQLFVPVTATARVYRSLHCEPADRVAVQLPAGAVGAVLDVGVVGDVVGGAQGFVDLGAGKGGDAGGSGSEVGDVGVVHDEEAPGAIIAVD